MNYLNFKKWLLEAKYSDDLSQLQGKPYIKVHWNKIPHEELILKYIWDGYPVLPHQKSYLEPGEFASFDATQDEDGWFVVGGVDVAEPFRRQGYATDLYKKALELVKEKGFKGLKSYPEGRKRHPGKEAESTYLWKSFPNAKEVDGVYYLT